VCWVQQVQRPVGGRALVLVHPSPP
jgi:hypothetical protein